MPLFKLVLVTAFAVINLGMLGCVPCTDRNVAVNTNTTDQQANTAPSNSNSKTDTDLSSVPFSMPMLDALLLDDEFVSEARMAVQLTDEEIDKLTTRSRDAVLNLSADPAEDLSRSTRDATERAKEQVREILGEKRGNEFITVAQRRWKGGSETELSGKPGSVPTDDRVVINIPAYRMDVFDDGRLVKSYKIGIGYPEFPLPTGLRKAEQIIFNPTWTPPDEPWVKGKVSPGKTVEAGSKLNPLGPIKIPIGLPSLIHGGKAPSRLGTFKLTWVCRPDKYSDPGFCG